MFAGKSSRLCVTSLRFKYSVVSHVYLMLYRRQSREEMTLTSFGIQATHTSKPPPMFGNTTPIFW